MNLLKLIPLSSSEEVENKESVEIKEEPKLNTEILEDISNPVNKIESNQPESTESLQSPEISQEMNTEDISKESLKPEGESPKTEGEGPKIEGEGPKIEEEGPKIEGEGSKIEGEGPKIEGEGPKIEGEGPKIEGEGPKIEGEGPKIEGEGPKPEGSAEPIEPENLQFKPEISDELGKKIQEELDKKKEASGEKTISREDFIAQLQPKRNKIIYHALWYLAFIVDDHQSTKQGLYEVLKEVTSKNALERLSEHKFYFGLGPILKLKLFDQQVRFFVKDKIKLSVNIENFQAILHEIGEPISERPQMEESKKQDMISSFLI